MSNTHLNLANYELALRLKNVGFNYWTEYYFDKNKEIIRGEYADYNADDDKVGSPNGYIIRQWLRNEYECDIFICRLGNITIPNIGYSFIVYLQDNTEPFICQKPFETYEDAEIAGINYIFDDVLKYKDEDEK